MPFPTRSAEPRERGGEIAFRLRAVPDDVDLAVTIDVAEHQTVDTVDTARRYVVDDVVVPPFGERMFRAFQPVDESR